MNSVKSWVIDNCRFAKHKPANTVSVAAFREVAGEWQVLVGLRSRPPAKGQLPMVNSGLVRKERSCYQTLTTQELTRHSN